MSSMKKSVIVALILFFVSIFTLIFLLFIKDEIKCELANGKEVNTEIYEEYNEAGIKLTNRGSTVSKKDYTLTVTGEVNTEKLGKYVLEYLIKYHGKKYKLKRIVNVIDSTPPVINTNIETVIKDYCTKEEIEELTINVKDNYDGELTENIKREDTDEAVIISVVDSNGNAIKKELPIKLTEKPENRFVLNSDATIYVPINTSFDDPKASLVDGCGKQLETNVTITGTVNTKVVGDYKLEYSIPDMKSVTRTVKVYDPASPSNKTIYLTFDDGPGIYTKNILDTLAKYNIKATFFVTNQFPKYSYLIKEEHEAGHAIGVHTYTHKYDVYKSLDAYVEDFNKMNEVIREQTGEYSKIFRFPGGASNTISKSYKKGIVSEVANYLTQNGYIYFDWNVDSTDAAGAGREAIIKRVTTDVTRCSKCVVLMHDIKNTTASALDEILKVLTSKGYSFHVLTTDGPTVHHKISN